MSQLRARWKANASDVRSDPQLIAAAVQSVVSRLFMRGILRRRSLTVSPLSAIFCAAAANLAA